MGAAIQPRVRLFLVQDAVVLVDQIATAHHDSVSTVSRYRWPDLETSLVIFHGRVPFVRVFDRRLKKRSETYAQSKRTYF